MNLDFREDQEILRNTAREFLEAECPSFPFVREMEEDERGCTPELWKKLAELGWMGIAFPEEYGGVGYDFADLAVLLEEMGRACLPGPYLSSVLGGLSILWAGTEDQKQAFLPKIVGGETVIALALTGLAARYTADAIQLQAKSDADSLILNGVKMFVQDAHLADYFLCPVRTKEGANAVEGITLVLVDTKSAGISCLPLKDTIARDKLFRLEFEDVKVPKTERVGAMDQGWATVEKILSHGAVAECARMLGGARRVLELCVSYAKERKQFQRPIGSFQIIQHYLAGMLTDVDGCHFTTHQAAWKLSQGLPAAREVSIAKAWANDAYYRVCVTGHQVYGANGFTEEYDLGLYFRREKAQELSFGDADFHRAVVARELGLE